jgi:hypothetical protein
VTTQKEALNTPTTAASIPRNPEVSSESAWSSSMDPHRTATATKALEYHDAGFSVIPVLYGDKRPALPWHKFTVKRAERAQVEDWFCQNTYNIGLVLGHGFFALDIDGQDARDHLWESFYEGPGGHRPKSKQASSIDNFLAWSMRTLTGGGGIHIFAAYAREEWPEGIKGRTLWQGISGHNEIALKAQGNYVVAAPSLHPSGLRYRLSLHTGLNVMVMRRCDIEYLFDAISGQRLRREQKIRRSADPARNCKLSAFTPSIMKELLLAVESRYEPGVRNKIVYALSGVLHKRGYGVNDALRFVTMLCNRTRDEELANRLQVVRNTFSKPRSEIAGLSILGEFV